MQLHKLNAVIRTGKGRLVRRVDQVPAVLYGRDMDAVSLAVPEAEVNYFINHGSANALINLAVGQDSYTVMMKDLQRDWIKGSILHVDFYAVDLKQELVTTVPVHLRGEAAGIKEGGVLQHQTREVEVRCLPTDIPQGFDLDVSALNIGDTLTVADLDLGETKGVEILTPETEVVVSVLAPHIEEEETEETESEDTEIESEDAESQEQEEEAE
jgi:large subunit ribosomal protein L25